ncbi:MAG: hypothetical protein E6K00_03225 [Methanobacteriota archaeon]|nr:MAG: hypothetical protein E6K00_03225 [Euryarchaeota archaeon]
MGEGGDGARQVMLPDLREAVDLLEDPLVEGVRPRVGQVRDDLGRLLRDPDQVLPFDRDDSVAPRPFALCDQDRRLPVASEQVLDETAVDHVAPVQDEERALEVGPGLRHAVRRAELLLLRDVRDAGVERLSVLEMRLDSLAPITDDEDQIPYAVFDQGLDGGLEEGPISDRDHDLRDRRREGSHAGAFSGGQDDGLHRSVTCWRQERKSMARAEGCRVLKTLLKLSDNHYKILNRIEPLPSTWPAVG